MSRSSALSYYSQTFAVPTTTYDAEFASNVFLWISLTILCIPILVMAFMAFKGVIGEGTVIYALVAIAARITWIITLSIIFHRI